MNAWMCDRCGKVSREGDCDDPPMDWRFTPMPVRGSEGARSTRDVVICGSCDDSLYNWLTRSTRENVETSCDTCAGSGVIDANHFGDRMMIEPCFKCDGTGRVSTPESVEEPA